MRTDKPLEPVRDLMIQTVENLGREAMGADELERFRQRALKEFDLAMVDSQRIGIELSEWAAMGDWRLMFLHRDRIEGLTLEQVLDVGRRYLKRSNRTVGLFVPESDADRAPASEPLDVATMVEGYEGRSEVRHGRRFEARIQDIEAEVQRGELADGLKWAILPKETRGGAVEGRLALHIGDEEFLQGKTLASELLPLVLPRGTRRQVVPRAPRRSGSGQGRGGVSVPRRSRGRGLLPNPGGDAPGGAASDR